MDGKSGWVHRSTTFTLCVFAVMKLKRSLMRDVPESRTVVLLSDMVRERTRGINSTRLIC